ncbi:M20/M25/M40 family metallo-hydrolase [Lutimaribacter sp. EGI FJ00015]|uniref:M20/M25/M40 family metallo-hydrolase n=1 Tax=Lutimaribacter degradans TaxID=2945989 RepID=A0ACC5ZT08_9RHOB|nr:M20/M25/M40 family metallo-hydrolase [Lutimaribacter sp. EGI FJ00013]MCM2561310.1 M20/M25/M40 family metallo-hydrolase [Lutimaribacter sp. EGI FJ00013]MCO0611739.1 M20/M25/M40 family metallo-hydrolase [Lutimaribacter sp. EGI FJ00015]MCO0635139.1 M20/M25/M40 family metallo-hydrolase [Lutimaribacter sp. EGI FJ00014]
MDPLKLPFDADEMLAGLRPWIECESPTHDAAAVDRMMDLAAYDLAQMAEIERIPGRMGFGGCLRARFPHPKQGEPGILILGHMDTVHPVGTLAKLPFKREGDICYGPGIMDMKGGNYAAVDAVRQLLRAGAETPLPVTVLFTPDEEVGTPSTRELIEAEAARNKYVLVPEPSHQDGGATIGRYAIARFNLVAEGQPSHAGARLSEGRSAIAMMARKLLEIEGMTGDDCTFSVGVVNGGQWVNCVSSLCEGQALSMAKRQEDLDDGVARMLALAGEENGVEFRITRGVTRPVWEPDQPGTMAMFDIAKDIAGDLGFELKGASAGGGSDGNFTGAMGIPTLDGLGVRGNGLHTLTEHIQVDSLPERGKLLAALLMRLT